MSSTPTTEKSTGPWSRAGHWLDRAEFWFIALACAGIVVLVFAGVLSRFVFSQPMAWSEELARYLFLWAALVGAAAGCRNNQHGGIPLLVHKFPPGGQRFVEVLVTVLVITVLVVLAWQSLRSTQQALESGQTSLASGIPVWVINGIALAAYVLAILRTAQGFKAGAYHPRNAVAE